MIRLQRSEKAILQFDRTTSIQRSRESNRADGGTGQATFTHVREQIEQRRTLERARVEVASYEPRVPYRAHGHVAVGMKLDLLDAPTDAVVTQ